MEIAAITLSVVCIALVVIAIAVRNRTPAEWDYNDFDGDGFVNWF